MPRLTQVEFNTIRELLGPALANKVKFQAYTQQVQDPQLRQVFETMSAGCDQKAKQLLGFL
ncbi:MAG TPA: hypothetical protein GX008_09240 [Firmicutes bacterium]|nr:MAG: hypothetical protein AA931_04080 [Peptococcaceae bacterium 1109]HHT73882.1 hypothetical protein [Bacillota bacterium]